MRSHGAERPALQDADPWPRVRTGGELEPAEREWLHTNGAGAYAMSTISLMGTRRRHGLLVAALPAPLGRQVIVMHAETSVSLDSDRRTYRLSTLQFPGCAPTPGYRQLVSFASDPIPRWQFLLADQPFEQTLCLVRGKNALILGFTWRGRGRAKLQLRPLMPLRSTDTLAREHGGMMQVLSLRPGAVEMQPVAKLPPIVFGHPGVFMGSPDWWRRFEYLADQSDGIEFQEDLWTPGLFETTLDPGRTVYLVVAVQSLPEGAPGDLMAEAAAALRGADPGPARPLLVRSLSLAAEQLCLDAAGRPAVAAGFPEHPLLVRDWVMAMPGLHLTRGRIDLAERALGTLLATLRGGLLPETLPEPGQGRPKALPDATLWLFELARALEQALGADHPLLRERLLPALVRVFARMRSRQRRAVWLSEDGLIVNGSAHSALTWMDAHTGPKPITPRTGIAIEQQALWTRGCETLSRLAARAGRGELAERALGACETARSSFRARFWCTRTMYPYDCVSEERDLISSSYDASIRPNALIALAVDPELFHDWQASAILDRVRADLLTPRGIRSLSPKEPGYVGQFAGSSEERELGYHQGTAWTHLLGFYVRAALHAAPEDADRKRELRSLIAAAAGEGLLLGQVAQLADGDTPHRARGCPAQATSVAELLRALVFDLGE